jgi:hypothetical protein
VNLNLGHIAFLVIVLMIGVVFAGFFRGLPGVSMLPQY